jgi:hypothetical protein
LAVFHIAYLTPRGDLLDTHVQDAEQLMADEAGFAMVRALAPRVGKPAGNHRFSFDGQFRAEVSLQWRVQARGSTSAQVSIGDRELCTAFLLSGEHPAVDEAALSAFITTLAALQTPAGSTPSADARSLRQRPIVLAVLWQPALDDNDRQALGAALAALATAVFRSEGIV